MKVTNNGITVIGCQGIGGWVFSYKNGKHAFTVWFDGSINRWVYTLPSCPEDEKIVIYQRHDSNIEDVVKSIMHNDY